MLLSVPVRGSERTLKALEMLNSVPAGKEIVQKAFLRWGVGELSELAHFIHLSHTSRTDSVLTRRLNHLTGAEERQRKVRVYLNQNQAFTHFVLDLAHELEHATSDPSWDPYDPRLTVGKYIQLSIEGKGGEVDAVVRECRVGLELKRIHRIEVPRCQRYGDFSGQKILRQRVFEDFYRVGKWEENLRKRLGTESEHVPFLSPADPRLYSSTGRAPYPVSLFREFKQMTEIACENSKRRLASTYNQALRRSTAKFINKRCLK